MKDVRLIKLDGNYELIGTLHGVLPLITPSSQVENNNYKYNIILVATMIDESDDTERITQEFQIVIDKSPIIEFVSHEKPIEGQTYEMSATVESLMYNLSIVNCPSIPEGMNVEITINGNIATIDISGTLTSTNDAINILQVYAKDNFDNETTSEYQILIYEIPDFTSTPVSNASTYQMYTYTATCELEDDKHMINNIKARISNPDVDWLTYNASYQQNMSTSTATLTITGIPDKSNLGMSSEIIITSTTTAGISVDQAYNIEPTYALSPFIDVSSINFYAIPDISYELDIVINYRDEVALDISLVEMPNWITTTITSDVSKNIYNINGIGRISNNDVSNNIQIYTSDARGNNKTYDFSINLVELLDASGSYNEYYTLNELRLNGKTPTDLSNANYTTEQIVSDGGYSVQVLNNNGYTINDISSTYSMVEIINGGYTLSSLKQSFGSTTATNSLLLNNVLSAGYTASDLKDASYNIRDIRSAGYTVMDVSSNDYTFAKLIDGGYTNYELLYSKIYDMGALNTDGSYNIATLRYSDFNYNGSNDSVELSNAGYSADKIEIANYNLADASTNIADLLFNNPSYTIQDVKNLGYNTEQLKYTGYTVDELIGIYIPLEIRIGGYTISDLSDNGFTEYDILTAHYDISDYKTAGYSTTQLKTYQYTISDLSSVYDISDIKIAWPTSAQYKTAGYDASYLKNEGGFTVSELQNSLYSDDEIIEAEYSASELVNNFTATLLKEQYDFSANALCNQGNGYSVANLQDAKYSDPEIIQAGYDITNLRTSGYSAGELKPYHQDVSGAIDMRIGGFTIKNLQDALYSDNDILGCGFTSLLLQESGYSISDLSDNGYSSEQILAGEYSAEQLRDNGYSAADLLNSENYRGDQLRIGGYTISQMILVPGMTNVRLLQIGYTLNDEYTTVVVGNKINTSNTTVEYWKSESYSLNYIKENSDWTTLYIYNAIYGPSSEQLFGDSDLSGTYIYSLTDMNTAGYTGEEIFELYNDTEDFKEAYPNLPTRNLSLEDIKNSSYIPYDLRYSTIKTTYSPNRDDGYVNVYDFSGSNWTQVGDTFAQLHISNLNSGMMNSCMQLSSDGENIIIANRLFRMVGTGEINVYTFNEGAWHQKGPTFTFPNMASGNPSLHRRRDVLSTSINKNGTIVAIANPFETNIVTGEVWSGFVRLFQWSSAEDSWNQMGDDITDDISGNASSLVGHSVSLNDDGNILVVGSPGMDKDNDNLNSGLVKIYTWTNNTQWIQIGQDIYGENGEDKSGITVSISNDGSTIAIGSPLTDESDGHLRIFRWSSNDTTWNQIGNNINGDFRNNDRLGISISLNNDGTRVAVGAPRNNNGYTEVYEYSDLSTNWVQLGNTILGEEDGDESGSAVSLSYDGKRIAIGAPNNDAMVDDVVGISSISSGHGRVYEFNDNTKIWEQLGNDIDSNMVQSQFGEAISIDASGTRVAILAQKSSTLTDSYGEILETNRFTLSQLVEAGYTTTQLINANYSKLEIYNAFLQDFSNNRVDTITHIRNLVSPSEFSIKDIITCVYGENPEDVNYKVSYIGELYASDINILQTLHDAGYSITDLINVVNPQLGYLKLTMSYSANDFRLAGYSPRQLYYNMYYIDINSGIKIYDRFDFTELQAGGYGAAAFKDLPYNAIDLSNFGYTATDLFNGGYPVNRLYGQVGDTPYPVYSIQSIRDAGYTATNIIEKSSKSEHRYFNK